jgi:cytoplasmic iron level regulating protein YaaA (DUF328/UPF0246 family)
MITAVSDVVILLPPSEGKAPGGGRPYWRPGSGRFGRSLRHHRVQVAAALAAAGGGDARLLGVSGAHLQRAQAANATCVDAPTLPAWQRFTGVVWEHLDVAGLDADARRRASDRIVIVSALTGLSALDDPVPDFRLKMSVTLAGLGRVAPWWRPALSEVLNRACSGALVVDLLAGEHAAAWDPPTSGCEVVRVDLVDAAGRRAGHAAKAAKGMLAGELVRAVSRRDAAALLGGDHRVGGFGVRVRT